MTRRYVFTAKAEADAVATSLRKSGYVVGSVETERDLVLETTRYVLPTNAPQTLVGAPLAHPPKPKNTVAMEPPPAPKTKAKWTGRNISLAKGKDQYERFMRLKAAYATPAPNSTEFLRVVLDTFEAHWKDVRIAQLRAELAKLTGVAALDA